MLKALRRRFEAWVTRHQRPFPRADPAGSPPHLHSADPPGLCFRLLLFLLFLWSINYSNSMGFAFTFLLAAVALNSMWQAHDNLLGLIVHSGGAEPVFAGQEPRFDFRLENPRKAPRHGIALQWRDRAPLYADIPAQGSAARSPWRFPPSGAAGCGRAICGS
jgi:hypothetical protein